MSRVVKICCGKWLHESRDMRELSVYSELGAEVLVMARGESGDLFKEETINNFRVFKFSSVFFKNKSLHLLNGLVMIFKWSFYARSLHADIISCHDIFALLIGWLSTVFIPKGKKPKLIYDSHEFEIGRNANRGKFKTWFIIHLERFLIKRCVFTIVVCDSIADEIQKVHNLANRPLVVRSTPERWELDLSVCYHNREKLRNYFAGKADFFIMYHGILCCGRGLDLLFSVVEREKGLGLILMGKISDEEEIQRLLKIAKEKKFIDRILIIPPVSQKEIWKYAGAVDLEMMLIQPIVKSYYFALPNKFFESVQSLTPIIASDLPEMKALIDKYQIGLTCDVNDIGSIVKAIERMRTDKDFYSACKKNLELAKNELCWENEKAALMEAFRKIDL